MTSLVDKNAAVDALEEAVGPTANVMRSIERPEAAAVGEWSAKHVAAHLASSTSYFRSLVDGEGVPVGHPDQRHQWNDSSLIPLLDRTMPHLADEYERGMADVVERIRSEPGDPRRPWIGGIPIHLSTAAAIATTEAAVHAYDMARARGTRYRISKRHAVVSMLGISETLPHFVVRERVQDLDAVFEVSLRSSATRIILQFRAGELTVRPATTSAASEEKSPPDATPRIDCHISADPEAYLLVGYGRVGQWLPLLQGKIVAWGRKPWLGFKLATAFEDP